MMRKLLKTLFIMALYLTLIVAIFAAGLPFALEMVLKHQLTKQGFTQPTLTIRSITPSRLHIKNLHCRRLTKDGNSITIQIPDIWLFYSPHSLANRMFTNVITDKPVVQVVMNHDAIALPTFKNIPFQHSEIDNGVVTIQDGPLKTTLSFSGNFIHENQKLQTQLATTLESNKTESQQLSCGVSATQQLDTNKGKAKLLCKLKSFSENQFDLNTIFPNIKYSPKITHGNLDVSGTINWQPDTNGSLKEADHLLGFAIQSNISLLLQDLSFSLNNIAFNEGNGEITFDHFSPVHSQLSREITFKNITSKILFNNVKTQLSIDNDNIEINTLSSDFSGGKISTNNLKIEKGLLPGNIIVQVEKIDAGTFLQSLQQEALSATGTFSGTITFSTTPQEIYITSGHLNADGAGTIKYSPNNNLPINAQPALQPSINILSNFSYTELALDITESAYHTLKATINTTGTNPSFYAGSPVKLTITVQEKLDNLWEYKTLDQQLSTTVQENLLNPPVKKEEEKKATPAQQKGLLPLDLSEARDLFSVEDAFYQV